jgi:hypoxanthine phosphoribosyltransferase
MATSDAARARRARVHPDIESVLLPPRMLSRRVAEMGRQITADYAGERPLLLGVLKAAVVFMVDLARAIDLPVQMEFLFAASYGASTTTSGQVRIDRLQEVPLAGRHVLVVDTVLDTGLTFEVLDAALRARQPASLRYVALVQKDRGQPVARPADYLGFTVVDRWLVGYGCDYAQRYRNLPYVGILRRSVYETPLPAPDEAKSIGPSDTV